MEFDSEAFDTDRDVETEETGDLELVHYAAARGDLSGLIAAINCDPSSLEQQDSEGLTPLALAVQSRQMASTKHLVMVGANINAQDNFGRTCLSVAAYQGWLEGVTFLLRNGAKNNITDKSGRSPLHASTYSIDTRTMEGLLQNMTTEEVNSPDHEKMNALHWAAFHNRPEHVRILLLRGANVSARDIDGKTPLHWATQNGGISCCQALLECPNAVKLINTVDHTGKSPVHYAAAAGHSDLIMILAEKIGCDLEIEDPDERTPLHWAAAMGHHDCMTCLLKLGVSPCPYDAEGGTPLEYASQSGHMECVKTLEKVLECRTSLTKLTTLTSKPSKGPLGILKDFFNSCQKENTIELAVRGEAEKSPDLSQKCRRRNKVDVKEQRALSSGMVPTPASLSRFGTLPDSQKTVFDFQNPALLPDLTIPNSSSLVKHYPPRLPPLSPRATVEDSPPTRSHELAPLKQIRSHRNLPFTDEACSDNCAGIEMLKSSGKFGKSLSPVKSTTSDNIEKSYSKHKVKKKQPKDKKSPNFPCSNSSKESPRSECTELSPNTEKSPSMPQNPHTSLDQSETLVTQEQIHDSDQSPKITRTSQVQNTLNTSRENLSVVVQLEESRTELTERLGTVDKDTGTVAQSRVQSILPETVKPRSHQNIASSSMDAKSSQSIKNDLSTQSRRSEERRNLDKSLQNLLQ